jgi:nicotinamidase-related amidase
LNTHVLQDDDHRSLRATVGFVQGWSMHRRARRRRQHCLAAGSEAAALARTLKPRQRDFTILKPRHSAFYATPLDLLLHELKCRRLVITGIAADSCVLFTAMDAYLRGYTLWIPADCVAAESPLARDRALEQMARVLKADVSCSESPRPGRRRG